MTSVTVCKVGVTPFSDNGNQHMCHVIYSTTREIRPAALSLTPSCRLTASGDKWLLPVLAGLISRGEKTAFD